MAFDRWATGKSPSLGSCLGTLLSPAKWRKAIDHIRDALGRDLARGTLGVSHVGLTTVHTTAKKLVHPKSTVGEPDESHTTEKRHSDLIVHVVRFSQIAKTCRPAMNQ